MLSCGVCNSVGKPWGGSGVCCFFSFPAVTDDLPCEECGKKFECFTTYGYKQEKGIVGKIRISL